MMTRLCVGRIVRKESVTAWRDVYDRKGQWTRNVVDRHNGTVPIVTCVASLCAGAGLSTDYLCRDINT